MEQGSKSLLIILCVALLLGAVVVGVHPAYRKALVSIAQGKPEESPIWKANKDYYPDVALPNSGVAAAPTEGDAGEEAAQGI